MIFSFILISSILSLINSYDTYLSKHFINLSQATYCVSSINNWNCLTCDESIKPEYIIEKHGARAIQGYDILTKSIFIAFRGSSNIQNWLDNIQISKISPYNDSSIQVEKGFYKSYQYLKSDLIINLQILSLRYNTNLISVTGHSLGAGQATLFVFDIVNDYNNYYHVLHFYNFGSPRVGNDQFANFFTYFPIKPFRVTHYYDIVPHLPEEILGYHHISNEIWYDEPNINYVNCKDIVNEDDTCSNSCFPTHCTSFDDHLYYLNVSLGNEPQCI
jgi:predicted lipase